MTAVEGSREWPGVWADDALCAQTDPELFHPPKGGSASDAKKVCGNCPVRVDCLEHALRNREFLSIWGGTTGNQRRRMLKKRRAA